MHHADVTKAFLFQNASRVYCFSVNLIYLCPYEIFAHFNSYIRTEQRYVLTSHSILQIG